MQDSQQNAAGQEPVRVSDPRFGLGKKIICIGECALDIIFDGTRPVGSMAAGRIVNAATILAREGMPVYLMGEAGSDPIGDMVLAGLREAGINTDAVDRFTDGHTPVNIFTPTPDPEGVPVPEAALMQVTRYDNYPAEGFDVVWPRIDAGDIVVFGGYYSLAPRTRTKLVQLLSFLQEKKVIIVYLPGFLSVQEPRITRVMPAILENLEYADVVVTRSHDLHLIFGTPEADTCYSDHIDFYCRNLININPACSDIAYYSGQNSERVRIESSVPESMMWNAGALSGVLQTLFTSGVTKDQLQDTPKELMKAVLARAAEMARRTADSLKLAWQKHN